MLRTQACTCSSSISVRYKIFFISIIPIAWHQKRPKAILLAIGTDWNSWEKAWVPIDGVQCLNISSSRSVTLTSLTNLEAERSRSTGEKDTFLQNTLPRNVIIVRKFFRQHNKDTEEVVSFSFFYYLGLIIDGYHFLSRKILPSRVKIKTIKSHEILASFSRF